MITGLVTMLAAAAVTAAPVAVETPAPTRFAQGVVMYKWYTDAMPEGPLGTPTGPECYGLRLATRGGGNDDICVSRADWDSVGFFSVFRGEAIRDA